MVTHVLEPRYMLRQDLSDSHSYFADLREDERELLVTAESQDALSSTLRVYEHDGKVIFQTSLKHYIRGIKALTDPRDGGKWLFYTYNDQDSVTLSAIQFNLLTPDLHRFKQFENSPRTDGSANEPARERKSMFHPEILQDIDGDGRLELVCRLSSGLEHNPRGLVAFDFETGKLKWRLDTGSNLTDVLAGDFDRNGSMEFIISNMPEWVMDNDVNGIDDRNGWLAVVDASGKILFSEMQFEGYGEIRLTSFDPGKGIKPYIFAMNNTWGSRRTINSVLRLSWNGSRLIRNREWSTANSFEHMTKAPIIASMDPAGKTRLFLIERGVGLVLLDQDLHQIPHHYDGFARDIWGVEDIDQDGRKEVLLQTPDNRFVILDSEMNTRAELNNPIPNAEKTSGRFVGRGLGTNKGIVVWGGNQTVFYGFYKIVWHTLLWRSIKEYSIYLVIVLVLIIILLIWYNVYNWQIMYIIMPSLKAAIVYLFDDDRLMYFNPFFLELVRAPAGKRKPSLKALSPSLSRMLMDFKASGDKLQNHEVMMGEDQMAGMYRVTLFHQRNPVYRYLMIINPIPTVNAAEKILWADTARRLSHHVRRHITNVILALPHLMDEQYDPEQRKEFQQIIKSEIEKIRVFTHSFQRFSELRDHDLRLHDVLPSVEHVLDHLRIPENVKLIRNNSLAPIHAFLDPIRFEEALVNLLNNSINAMPDGGYLQITTKAVTQQESPRNALTVMIEIEDSGVGIPEKYMDEVWKPFFTTNQSGTGIGLPESRKIIESMGGMLTLHSEEGIGTVASIWLRGEGD
ncbi:MAG: ATP-binding protein [Candidatus Cloacimonadaceae bacterium]|nr:ATP-binding protein [Candidatus Cloacimonadaceae bacterium]